MKGLLKNFFSLVWWQRLLVYVVVLGLVSGGWYCWELDSKIEQQNKINEQIAQLDKKLAHLKQLKKKLKKIEERFDFYQKQFVLAKQLLPENTKALDRLLASFEAKGIEKGIEFVYFKPLNEVQYDFYAARNVDIKLKGSFNNIVSYLDELSHLNRLLTISSLNFRPQGEQEGVSNLAVDCKLQVYRSLTDAEIKARQKNKKKRRR